MNKKLIQSDIYKKANINLTKAGNCKHIAFIHIDNETKIQYIKVWNQDAVAIGVY